MRARFLFFHRALAPAILVPVLLLPLLLLPAGCRKKAAADTAATEDDAAVAVQAEHPSIGPISEEIAADAILAPRAE